MEHGGEDGQAQSSRIGVGEGSLVTTGPPRLASLIRLWFKTWGKSVPAEEKTWQREGERNDLGESETT